MSEDEHGCDPVDQMILADLQSEDPARIERGYQTLTEHLLSYARSLLRTRLNQVNLQDGSVVQSALAGLLEHGHEQFENEAHLQGRMRLAVLRKIQDRIKAGKNRMVQASEGDALHSAAGSATDSRFASRVADSDRPVDVRGLLLEGLKGTDRDLVDLRLLQQWDSKQTGEMLSMTAELVRQRVTRLRPALRARLLEPVRHRVLQWEWQVVKLVLLDRLHPQQASEAIGIDQVAISEELLRIIDEVVRPTLGPEGCDLLVRLLGRAKS